MKTVHQAYFALLFIAVLASPGYSIWWSNYEEDGKPDVDRSSNPGNRDRNPEPETYPAIESTGSIEVCNLPMVKGPCRARKQRYYYDSTTGSCSRFTYGGCQGNENNFETSEECEAKCSPKSNNVCELAKDAGPCYGSMPKWFYNKDTKECEPFTYGGCQGNDNNFVSIRDCQKKCKADVEDICSLEMAPGPCYASFPSFYFDKATGRCQKFTYGGCQGNKNRFTSVDECMSICGGDRDSNEGNSWENRGIPVDRPSRRRDDYDRNDRHSGRDEYPSRGDSNSDPIGERNPYEDNRDRYPDVDSDRGGCQDLHGDNCNFRGTGGLEYAKQLCNDPDHRERMRKSCCITCQRLDRQE